MQIMAIELPRGVHGSGKVDLKSERCPRASCDQSLRMDLTFLIDGNNFSNLPEFYEEFRRVLTPGIWWGSNLDAFNDVLRGGFGTPDEGYTLVWKNSNLSKQRLGYSETVAVLEQQIRRAHPTARATLEKRIADAKRGVGPTVFDWLVDAIRNENPKIELVLK